MTRAEYQRMWRAAHPTYSKEYYKKNKDQLKNNMARYYTKGLKCLTNKDIKELRKAYEIIGKILNSVE